jgi:hypothetical protein
MKAVPMPRTSLQKIHTIKRATMKARLLLLMKREVHYGKTEGITFVEDIYIYISTPFVF